MSVRIPNEEKNGSQTGDQKRALKIGIMGGIHSVWARLCSCPSHNFRTVGSIFLCSESFSNVGLITPSSMISL